LINLSNLYKIILFSIVLLVQGAGLELFFPFQSSQTKPSCCQKNCRQPRSSSGSSDQRTGRRGIK